MAAPDDPRIGKLVLLLGILVAAGVPVVAYLWNAVNEVMAGDLFRLAVVVPLLGLFVAFLILLGWQVRRLGPP
jgi:hypothetical protein